MKRFITFEGIEGSGKSTQVRLASEFLADRGVPHRVTREPGGTHLGDGIRGLLLDPGSGDMSPMAELLLIGAARAQHVDRVIRPALRDGGVVLCDRFEDSTRAYQGCGRGLPESVLDAVCSLTAADLEPGLTFLFDLSPEDGLRRARTRNVDLGAGHEARFDDEELDFHRRVRDGFLELARRAPVRFQRIDARDEPDQVAGQVARALTRHLQLARPA